MGKLLYAITTSLNGYVADKNDNFDWAMPSEEVHFAFNDIVRTVGTSLFGRKMYEIMKVWDTIPTDGDSQAMDDYAAGWKTTKKIIYSTTLTNISLANATLESTFDASVVQKLVKESANDFAIGGPGLAGAAIRAGIVDEFHQFIAPIIVGGGNYWLPTDVEVQLELIDMHTFDNGFVHLHYRKQP